MNALERVSEPLSGNEVDERVTGKRDGVRLALDLLVNEGYVNRRVGANRSKLHQSVRPGRSIAPGRAAQGHTRCADCDDRARESA